MHHDTTEDTVSDDVDFVLAIGADEKLIRRLNDLDHAETCSTGNKGTDARWKIDPKEMAKTMWDFASTQ